jgi:hypothetical protein
VCLSVLRPFERSLNDIHLAVRYDRVDTAIGASRFATGSAMAYSNSYRFAFVLVGPVTADTASFDHIGGLLFDDLKAERTIAGRLCRRLNYSSRINVFAGSFHRKADCCYLCCQHTAVFYLGANWIQSLCWNRKPRY